MQVTPKHLPIQLGNNFAASQLLQAVLVFEFAIHDQITRNNSPKIPNDE